MLISIIKKVSRDWEGSIKGTCYS